MKIFLFVTWVIAITYSSINLGSVVDHENNWEGVYKSEIGELTITNITDKGFDFKILIETEECIGAIGKAKATAIIKNENEAVYTAGECNITFKFQDENTIIVTEKECYSYHGVKCNFSGTYKR